VCGLRDLADESEVFGRQAYWNPAGYSWRISLGGDVLNSLVPADNVTT
jgi:hypothetical protein